VKLRLIKESEPVKEERGTSLIPTFRFTRFGYVFSQIMQCIYHEDKKAEEELYKLFHERLFKVKEDSPSFLIFTSKMMEKMYEKDLFGIYISNFRKVLDSDVTDIESFVKLVQNTISRDFLRRRFFIAWEETINELDQENRKLFMYDQKHICESRMGAKAVTKSYERLRLELREETETVALEGFCTACNKDIAFPMNLIEYIRRIVNAHVLLPSITCPKCNAAQRTLRLPFLL
jgi:hypothetical protein